MSKNDDGGPDEWDVEHENRRQAMLLDRFAGQAMASILVTGPTDGRGCGDGWADVVARASYKQADAMLAEHRKRLTPKAKSPPPQTINDMRADVLHLEKLLSVAIDDRDSGGCGDIEHDLEIARKNLREAIQAKADDPETLDKTAEAITDSGDLDR